MLGPNREPLGGHKKHCVWLIMPHIVDALEEWEAWKARTEEAKD
jgi:hypothetical protein